MDETPVHPVDENALPCCQRRGRPRAPRFIPEGITSRCYAPQCRSAESAESIVLLPDELEILRLVDLLGLEQEEAAARVGVSRKTLWRDLHAARKKITDALVNGKTIQVEGCILRNDGRCPKKDFTCPKAGGGPCPIHLCREL